MGRQKESIRERVHDKLDGRCAYCSDKISLNKMTLDHIHPKCLGGPNDIANYLPACTSCNVLKGHKSLDEFREEVMNELIKLTHKNKYLNIALKLNLIHIDPDFKFLYESDMDLDELDLVWTQLRVLKHDNHLLRQNVDIVKDQENLELKKEIADLKMAFHNQMSIDAVYERQKQEIESLREQIKEMTKMIFSSFNQYLILECKNIARKYGELHKLYKTKLVR